MSRFISYLITDPLHYGTTPTKFIKRLKKSILRHSVDMVCIRDKENPKLKKILKRAAKTHHHLLVNSDIRLARRFGLFGVHLTSKQLHLIKRAKRMGLFVVASTHSPKELKRAAKADMVTYSPIFKSPGKPAPKGLGALRGAVKKQKNIIALGGIVKKRQINRVKIKRAAGFASIRYFV